jgi:hypothetical protein
MSQPGLSTHPTKHTAPSGGTLGHPAKAVYFATGSPELALKDIVRLGLAANGTAIRVVTPRDQLASVSRHPAVQKTPVIAYTPGRALWVWLKLLAFLGFTRDAELICLNTPQNYRLLKLLAFSLRGRGRFSTGEGETPSVSVLNMLRLSWHNYWIRREQRINAMPVLVVGSASPRSLRLIASRLRQRFPGSQLVAWLPEESAPACAGLFDTVHAVPSGARNYRRAAMHLLRSCRRFKACLVPCTNEFQRWMSLPALLIPFRAKEICNEVGDSFKFADWRSGFRHLNWRFVRTNRKLAWPVAVIGSASGFYLEKIVASLRRSFPGSEIHGWLAPLQAESAGHLFDAVHRLPSTSASPAACRLLLAVGRRYSNWIIPCTEEPFGWLKLLAISLPLPKRRLYNERGDGFPLRNVATVWRHIRWRLRHKFTIQFLAASPESSLLQRLVHVPAYAARLAWAAPTLLRATRRKPEAGPPRPVASSVEVLLTSPDGSRDALSTALVSGDRTRFFTRNLNTGHGLFDQLLAAARQSEAEYLCLLDGACEFASPGWLGKLLASFDETVAQAGPELLRADTHEICQGAFFDQSGGLRWNTNSAARFHGRPQLLEVAALPWVCLVIRREALLQVAPDCQRQRIASEWILAELSYQFTVNGWLSICNTEVGASHPMQARAEQLHLSTAS